MYKTGDLGAYNERGELMFLGRKDSQIKKQGYRIELGEIECAIKACQAVTQGCCFYQAATQQIVCCYSGEDDEKALRGDSSGGCRNTCCRMCITICRSFRRR